MGNRVFPTVKHNFRINTHVNTSPNVKYTQMGRLNSENVPWREYLAYQLAQTLGLPTPATRLARIHYIDTGSKTDFTRNVWLYRRKYQDLQVLPDELTGQVDNRDILGGGGGKSEVGPSVKPLF